MNYYAILGVSARPTLVEIDEAYQTRYHAIQKELHTGKPKSARSLSELNEAYDYVHAEARDKQKSWKLLETLSKAVC